MSQSNTGLSGLAERENGFQKFDDGKPLAAALPVRALQAIIRVLTFGAKRYGRNNWRKNTDLTRYEDALMRHALAHLSGEYIDPDSGEPHLAHVATNALFILELHDAPAL